MRAKRLGVVGMALAILGVGLLIIFVDPAEREDNLASPLSSSQLAQPLPQQPPGPPPSTEGSAVTHGTVDTVDTWAARYARSSDYFSFAEAAAREAIDGDGSAQYFLGQALLECKVQLALVDHSLQHEQGSLADAVEASLTNRLPGLRDVDRQQIRTRAARCERFHTAHPLDAYSLSEEEKAHRYWFDKAVAAEHPLAVMDRAAKVAVQAKTADETTKRELRAIILGDVRVAVTSRDPPAIFKVGGIYMLPTIARDPLLQGPAWFIAACELGYDCSQANPEIGHGCVESGTCNGILTMADILQRDLGAAQYAKIYAASQDILYRINTGDWEGLQQYLEAPHQ